MCSNIKNEFMEVVQTVLQDYAITCGVTGFDGQVIITDDMAETYTKLRKDLVDSGVRNLADIQRFHGLTVQPIDKNGKFTIVLNMDYIMESVRNNNVNWLGTLVHEAVHVNDFYDYFDLVTPDSFDELYEFNKHRMFLYWTEFHARAIGHYFLRKYTLNDFRDIVHLESLLDIELPYQINYMVTEVAATDDVDRQMYVIVHFMGRLAIWQYLYPDAFDLEFINNLFATNPWMEELYYLFLKYENVAEIYPHFEEAEEILNRYFGVD